MNKRLLQPIILIFLITLFLPGTGTALIRIDINSPGLTQFPVSVAPFKAMGSAPLEKSKASELSSLLEKDLDFTGYFKLINPTASLEDLNKMGIDKNGVQFKAWSIIGVEMLVTGGVLINGGELTLELRLFDVSDQSIILGKRYTGEVDTGLRMIHKFGNEILRYLTGFDGYFLSKIAFAGGDHRSKDIYVMDFNGENAKKATNYKSITITPRFAPSGKEIAFVSYKDGQPNLYAKNLITGKVSTLSARKGLNISPAWTASGTEIALTLSSEGDENIYLINTSGKIIRQLTKKWGINVSPSWAPDGEKMAFVSDRSGNGQVYIKYFGTGDVERLTLEGKRNLDPTWSPRGDRIAFSGSGKQGMEIFTIKPDGSDLRQLTFTGGLNLSPAWSPDGSMIVFSSDRGGEKAIYVMNANGANQRRLTFMDGAQESPNWSVNLE